MINKNYNLSHILQLTQKYYFQKLFAYFLKRVTQILKLCNRQDIQFTQNIKSKTYLK